MSKRYLDLSTTLKKLLFERNMKTVDLAREVGLPQPTVHRLVTGKSTRPYKSSLKPIADYFSLSVEQLLGEETIPNNFWHTDAAIQSHPHQIKNIPIIAWAQVHDLAQAKAESKQAVVSTGNLSDDCFALIMQDYSMEPLFPKRTILIFDPHKKAGDRSLVLAKLDGINTPIFRQLLVDIDHQYLKPLNPDLNTYHMRLLGERDKIIATLFESRINYQQEDDNNLLEDYL